MCGARLTGNHFELFAWQDKDPFVVGDLVNGELHGTQWGDAFVAKPATPADEFPKLTYLQPPPLHKVPYNGLAKTLPMGWNSWNLFRAKIDDKTVRTHGGCDGVQWDAGCWLYLREHRRHLGRRAGWAGNLQANPKFPDMKALADYVHSKGLKLGIYSSPGPRHVRGIRPVTGTRSRMRRRSPRGESTI